MLTIGICDDDNFILMKFKKMFHAIAEETGIKLEIICFNKSEHLTRELKRNVHIFDLLVLDILLGEDNGVDIGYELRRHNESVDIIYASSSNHYVFDAFKSLPTYYIRKNEDSDEAIHDILKKAIYRKNKKKHNTYTINIRHTVYHLELSKISYIEIRNRTLYIRDMNDQDMVHFNSKLSDFEETLNVNHFIRIHRSIIINLEAVILLKSEEVKLSSGVTLPIGRKYKSHVRQAFLDFIQNMQV